MAMKLLVQRMNDQLLQLLTVRYPALKSQFPNDGRRKLHLRVLEEFWSGASPATSRSDGDSLSDTKQPPQEVFHDRDPFDLEGQESGLLVRTDFSNEDAWQAFCSILQDSEREIAEALRSDNSESGAMEVDAEEHQEGPDSESDDDASDVDNIPAPLIKVINPVSTEHRLIFTDMSNLRALRLFNDLDIRFSPSPPPGMTRISPPNRLIDQAGWQEIYSGRNIWIYDASSNTDQCVRLVSQQGNIYGTATGDSWRARRTHICELQFNMTYLNMQIDFGGLDRWDYVERKRNLDEANQPIT